MNTSYRRESRCRHLAKRWMYQAGVLVLVLQVHITRKLTDFPRNILECTTLRHL